MLYRESTGNGDVLHITDRYGTRYAQARLPAGESVSLRDVTWSPGGAHFAVYVPDTTPQVTIYNRGGEQVAQDMVAIGSTQVHWSPDGAHAAVTNCEQGSMNCGVQFINVTAGADAPQVFVDATWSNVLARQWSPDGATYGFEVGFVTRGEQQFHLVDVASGAVESLSLRRSTREYFPCQWAQDGVRVLCVTETAIRLFDVATGEETRLSKTEDFLPQNADWQPGGELLLTWYGANGLEQRLGVYRAGEMTQIDTFEGLLRSANWTPNGERALLEIMNRGQRDIHLLERDLTLRQLTEQGVTNERAQWSPDEAHMLFLSDRDGSIGTYIMALASGRVQRVSPPGVDTCCAAWR
jgi:dipeptidyl aminopeptidase/acylaminoacyl peptidase